MLRGPILGALILTLAAVPAAGQVAVRLEVDNDAFVVKPVHDRDYTHGLRLSVGRVRCVSTGCDATSLGLTHALFTPNITNPQAPPLDRPYAGYIGLKGTRERWVATGAWRVDATLGVRGPAALGGPVQSTVHDVLGFKDPVGWENQLPTAAWVGLSGVVARWTTLGKLRLGGWTGAEAGTMRVTGRGALRLALGPDGRWLKPMWAPKFGYGIGLEGGVTWKPWDATLVGADGSAIPEQRNWQPWIGVDQTVQYKGWALTWSMMWQGREFAAQPTGPTAGAIQVRYAPRLEHRTPTAPAAPKWPAPSSQ